jgi:2-phospho-L-lactate guanylyltransferase
VTTLALIPVKELSQAKARLAPALTAGQRQELALALARDLVDTARACRALDGVTVVTRDTDVEALARAAGAEVLVEPGSLNEALTGAAEQLRARGVRRLVVLVADLPLATPEALARVAEADTDVVVVPSRDGGTNALALAPGAVPFMFGPESAQRHLDAAASAGLRAQRLEIDELALDIDTPKGIERLRAAVEAGQTVGARTRAALERLGITAPAAGRQ